MARWTRLAASLASELISWVSVSPGSLISREAITSLAFSSTLFPLTSLGADNPKLDDATQRSAFCRAAGRERISCISSVYSGKIFLARERSLSQVFFSFFVCRFYFGNGLSLCLGKDFFFLAC